MADAFQQGSMGSTRVQIHNIRSSLPRPEIEMIYTVYRGKFWSFTTSEKSESKNIALKKMMVNQCRQQMLYKSWKLFGTTMLRPFLGSLFLQKLNLTLQDLRLVKNQNVFWFWDFKLCHFSRLWLRLMPLKLVSWLLWSSYLPFLLWSSH